MRKKPQAYLGIHALEEDKRIALIGEAASKGQRVAFHVDDEPGKADRYIEKLLKRFPHLKVDNRFKGPTPGVETVIVIRMESPAD
jgi:hypothetical protein